MSTFTVTATPFGGSPVSASFVESGTAPPTTVPPAPTGLSLTPGDGSLLATWDPVAPEFQVLDYQVYLDGGQGSDHTVVTAAAFDWTGLTPGSTHSLRVSARNVVGYGPWGPSVSGTAGGDVPPPPPPPPPGASSFSDPFVNSPLRRPSAGVAADPNSAQLVQVAIGQGALPTVNVFGSGERRTRGRATDPLYTFFGSGQSHQARAEVCPQGSGFPDDTYGVYDEGTRTVVRGWGGDSVALQRDCTARTIRGATMGVADLDGTGIPFKGNGTAWGRMSVEGVMLARDVPVMRTRLKVALGNNLNARSFRAPAISFESKATGPAYPAGVPHGTTFVHNYTDAEIEAAISHLTGRTLEVSRAFWRGLRDFGFCIGDGTGTNGFNIYLAVGELGISSSQASSAVRINSLWSNLSRWRALVAG